MKAPAPPSTGPDTGAKAPPGKLTILIDGECDFCRNSARWIKKFDTAGAIEVLDFHQPADRARFPQLDPERLTEELHAVDERGEIYRGARAVNEVFRYQGGLRSLLAYLWYIPGYAWLANREYKRFAASRYQRTATGSLKTSDP